jgi:hypothetical protein
MPASVPRSNKEYRTLVRIAKSLINERGVKEFSDFFMEGQYFIDLWTAHIILDFGNADQELREECVKVIRKYSESRLDERLAREEASWLKARSL